MSDCPSQTIVTADTPANDGCPVLTRTRAFLVDQGVRATLEHVMRDAKGQVVDLRDCAEDGESDSDGSTSTVVLRIAPVEAHGCLGPDDLVEIEGTIHDAAAGKVRAQLTAAVASKAGIYQLSWGVLDTNGELVLVNRALLSVERSLFAPVEELGQGPPTINEIRLSIRDSHANDNLLLDDVEFDDAEIVQAIVRPVQYWNEQPPPVAVFRVSNFPFREMWLRAIHAMLFRTAAEHYRRNRLPYQAGGVTVDDRNKEKEYLASSKDLQMQWEEFVVRQKVAINARKAFGRIDTHGWW